MPKLECLECHLGGVYSGTRAECRACHSDPDGGVARRRGWRRCACSTDNLNLSNLYPNHFEGDCQDCHGLENWEPVAFNHVGVVECMSCHQEDVPVERGGPGADGALPGRLHAVPYGHGRLDSWRATATCARRTARAAMTWEKPAEHYEEYAEGLPDVPRAHGCVGEHQPPRWVHGLRELPRGGDARRAL